MSAASIPIARSRQSIGSAAVILLGGFIASRLLGLLRDVLIGARFGTTPDYDLYVAAFKIPDAIFTLIAGGALGSVLVPVFSELLASSEPPAGSHPTQRSALNAQHLTRLASSVLNLLALVAGVAAVLGIVFAPHLVPLFGGFSAEQQARLTVLVRVLLLQPVFFGIAEVLTRFLNAHHHFTYPAIAPALYNLSIIAGAVFLGPRLGTLGLAIGVSAGALVYLLVQVPEALRFGFRWQPALDAGDPALRQIAVLMLPRMIGQGAVQFSNIFTTRIASYLPAGRLSALNYAFLIMMLPLGTFAMSLSNAAFPTLSSQAAQGDVVRVSQTARRSLGTILFLMIPSALGLIVLGLPGVQTVFQRRAFTYESSVLTATALGYYALGLPAHGAIEILARSFYALKDTRTPVGIGIVAMAGNIALAAALAGPMGHSGIALALSLSATAEALALFILLSRRLPELASGDLLRSVAKTLVAGFALATLASICLVGAQAAGLSPLAQLVMAGGAGGLTFLVVAWALRSPDLMTIVEQAARRLER